MLLIVNNTKTVKVFVTVLVYYILQNEVKAFLENNDSILSFESKELLGTKID